MNTKNILDKMNLKEKVAQLNQRLYGWEIYDIVDGDVVIKEWFKEYIKENEAVGVIYGVLRADSFPQIDFKNGLDIKMSKKAIKVISDYVCDHSRFNLRPIFIEETPHGHLGLNSIMYPTNIAIGASFNPEMYAKTIIEISQYMSEFNVNIGLFSGLDIVRNSKWGRTEECFSEDPYLASTFVEKIAENSRFGNFTGCLKHFAGQGDPYIGLNSGGVNAGPREIHEIHLEPIRKHAEKIDMVMASYNEIDGIPCHANRYLLTDVLRNKFKFNGVVLSDGCALDRLVSNNVDKYHAAKMALNAGVDLSLWDDVYTGLEMAVNEGIVDIANIDLAVERILLLKDKLNLIDNDLYLKDSPIKTSKLAAEMANETIILAKNKNKTLPISKSEKVLLVGEYAEDFYNLLGDYTPPQKEGKVKTVLQAFNEVFETVVYCNYKDLNSIDLNQYQSAVVICGGSSKRSFDMDYEANGAVIFTNSLQMDCGENADVSNIAVKKEQENAIKILKQKSIDVTALFIQGRPYSMESVLDNADSIVFAYYCGEKGADAIVNTLVGENNPSGKCPATVLQSSDYIGYHYNSKKDFRKKEYIDNDKIIAFPFGHGLSYSDFYYRDFTINKSNDAIEISLIVENNSEINGKEVVQVYVEKENSIITKRNCELISFTKKMISANSYEKFSFYIPIDDLSIYNLDMEREIEKGVYTFFIGNPQNRIFTERIVI